MLGLGAEDGKAQKTVCVKRAKYITHKGSNAFPEKATIAEHHWQIDFGRGSGEAISYRSALEDFGKKNQEESRNAEQHSNWLRTLTRGHPWTAVGGSVFVPLVY